MRGYWGPVHRVIEGNSWKALADYGLDTSAPYILPHVLIHLVICLSRHLASASHFHRISRLGGGGIEGEVLR